MAKCSACKLQDMREGVSAKTIPREGTTIMREPEMSERDGENISDTPLGKSSWWSNEPVGVPRVAAGVRDRVARLTAIGNGQVPQAAALAWRLLMEELETGTNP